MVDEQSYHYWYHWWNYQVETGVEYMEYRRNSGEIQLGKLSNAIIRHPPDQEILSDHIISVTRWLLNST